ncbi:ABC transporter ATP-binding protein [Mycoplasma marinum]|uniref:ATP-binding cassette domain-containing protein n=1 Tax=Mycoplasma marinum TaxID=1937190 RepID=UPI003B2ABFA6
MKKLSLYNKRYIFKKPFMIFGLVFIMVSFSALSTGLSYLNNVVINSMENNDNSMFYKFLAIMAIMGLICSIWYLIRSYFCKYMAIKVVLSLKNDISTHISENKGNFFKEKNSSKYLNWLTQDARYVQEEHIEQIFDIASRFIALVLAIVGIMLIQWIIGIFIIFSALILLIITDITKKYLSKKKIEMSNYRVKFNQEINAGLSSFETYYLNNKEQYVSKKISEKSNEYYKHLWAFSKSNAWVELISWIFLETINYSILIVVGFLLVYKNNIGVGLFVASMLLLTTSLRSIRYIFNSFISIRANSNITRKLLKNATTNEIEVSNHILNECAIKVDNVSFWFDESKKIFENLNFKINTNQKYALVGANGSGKTTLIKLLLKILTPKSGEITWEGKGIDVQAILNNISMINDGLSLFPGNISENISFKNNDIDMKFFKEICEIVDLKIINEGNIYKDVKEFNFSSGEIQKLLIIRALYNKRKILIFDEAFSNIDAKAKQKIFNYLINNKELTLIMISHQFSKSDLMLFDEVIKLTPSSIS